MRTIVLSLGAAVFLTASLAADDALPPKTLTALKRATVFVEVEAQGQSVSGSGFVVQVDGTSALIVTNHHVVEPTIVAQRRTDSNVIPAARPRTLIRPRGPGMAPFPLFPRGPAAPDVQVDVTPRVIQRTLKNAAVTVVFDSGTKDERSVKAEPLALDPDFDLAVLRVKDVKDLPQPIDIEKAAELAETMSVYTFGFPFGKVLATGKKRPAITVGKAAISSLREDDDGELAVVQIDGSLNPGNSGGPIVNSAGELVGVAVATIRNSNGIGLAIPPGPLKNVFAGRIGAVHLSKKPNAAKPALLVEVGVIDPLGKIASVALHYIGMSRVPDGLDSTGLDALEKIVGSEQAKLTLEKQLASGEISPPSVETETEFLVQAVFTTADAKVKKTRVFRQSLHPLSLAATVPGANPGSPPNVPLEPNFKDRAPEKGVLIGFEIGLGEASNREVVKSLRPIYRSGTGEVKGGQYGTDLHKVVTLKAKEGYAVGGISMRNGVSVFTSGLSLVFSRIKDGQLDAADSYASDWLGDLSDQTPEKTTRGDGPPVIGIAGRQSDKDFLSLELIFEGK